MKITIIKKICQILEPYGFIERWGHLLEGSDILRNIIMAGENCRLQFRYLPRSRGARSKKNPSVTARIDADEMPDDEKLEDFATAIHRQEFIEQTAGESGAGTKIQRSRAGGTAYNCREYAKHFQRAKVFKSIAGLVLFVTVTAPTGFWGEEKEITPKQFEKFVLSKLKTLCGRAGAKQMTCFQPQENGHPHAHILLFTTNGRYFAEWKKRILTAFSEMGSAQLREVKEEEFKQTFDYLHYYTKYSAETYLAAKEAGDIELMKKAGKALKIIAWCSANGIPRFVQSGGRNMEEKLMEFPAAGACGIEAKTDIAPKSESKLKKLEKIVDAHLESGCKNIPKEVAKAGMEILEILFPCVRPSKTGFMACSCMVLEMHDMLQEIFEGGNPVPCEPLQKLS